MKLFTNYDYILMQLIFVFLCYLLLINFLTFFVLFLSSLFVIFICFFLYYNNLMIFAVLLTCVECQLFYIIYCLAFTWLKFDSTDISNLSISLKNISLRYYTVVFLLFIIIYFNNFFFSINDFSFFKNLFFVLNDIFFVNLSTQQNIRTIVNILFNNIFIYNSFEFFLINFFMLFAVILFGSLQSLQQTAHFYVNFMFFNLNKKNIIYSNDFFLKRQQQVTQLNRSHAIVVYSKNKKNIQKKLKNFNLKHNLNN